MSARTSISWAHATLNWWIGCTVYSPECNNCYAREQDRKRFSKTLGGATKEQPIPHWGKGAPRHLTDASRDGTLLRWNKQPFVCSGCGKASKGPITEDHPFHGNEACWCDGRSERRRVFIGSLMDWADQEVPDSWRDALFTEAEKATDLTLMFLTKRAQNAHRYLTARYPDGCPDHFWIGMSWMQDRPEDIQWLLKIQAAIRFLSVEPMLGPVGLANWLWRLPEPICSNCPKNADCECGYRTAKENGLPSIDWVILGGESGPNRRDPGIEPLLSVVRQCTYADVPVFVKQDCALRPGQQGRIPDGVWTRKEFPSL